VQQFLFTTRQESAAAAGGRMTPWVRLTVRVQWVRASDRLARRHCPSLTTSEQKSPHSCWTDLQAVSQPHCATPYSHPIASTPSI